jgi:hypothetical protein
MKQNKNDVLRFHNYKEFILNENKVPKKNDTIVIVLCYNQIENVRKLCDFFISQPVDVLFIDNSSNDGTYDFLIKNYKDNFNIIRTKENLGGAGGFALGIEYILSLGYEYCILTEEDALPLDEDIIENLLKYKDQNVEVLTTNYELGKAAFTFHFHLYPTWIFKEVGVPDYRLFFRADDREFRKRIEHNIKLKKIRLNKYYSHPIIKQGFGILANYFKFRNSLIVYKKYPRKNKYVDIFLILLKNIWYSFFSIFFDRNFCPFIQIKDAIIDILLDNFPQNYYTINKEKIRKYKNCKLKPNQFKIETNTIDEFLKKYEKYRLISPILKESRIGKNFEKSNTLSFFVSDKYINNSRVIAFFAKKILFVEEIDFLKNTVKFISYDNNRLKTIPLLVISFFVSIVLLMFLYPAVLIKRSNKNK